MMPRPADAKVWNEDLVEALRARHEQCRQQGSQRQFLWRDGAAAIEAVRQDIYAFRTGRIVGLPSNLKKTVEDLCRAVITGQAPVYPPGFAPTLSSQPQAETSRNPYLEDPYLKKIKADGGAAAILLAFRVTGKDVLTKAEICRIGQQFCSEQMEANFHQGRTHGAWSAINTLSKHGLVQTNKTTAYNHEVGGFRAQGAFTYALTKAGEKFTEALLDTRPALADTVGNVAGPLPTATRDRGVFQTPNMSRSRALALFASHSRTGVRGHSVGSSPRRAASAHALRDEKELRDWVMTASVGHQKMFQVGKSRRKHLHDVCHELNALLAQSGKALRHASEGADARSRALYVTMIASNSVPSSSFGFLSPSTPDISGLQVASAKKTGSPRKQEDAIFSGRGHALTSTKRSRVTPPKLAAAEAAMLRQAIHESKVASQKPPHIPAAKPTSLFGSKKGPDIPAAKPCSVNSAIELLDDSSSISSEEGSSFIQSPTSQPSNPVVRQKSSSATRTLVFDKIGADVEQDRKPPAVPRLHATNDFPSSKQHESSFVEVLDSDSDDDILHAPGLAKATVLPKSQSKATASSLIETHLETDGMQLKIIIDNRERDRNVTPRTMRMELTRIVERGPISLVWPTASPPAIVEEQALPIGDFAFDISREYASKRIPCVIERKVSAQSFLRIVMIQLHSHFVNNFKLMMLRESVTSSSEVAKRITGSSFYE